MPWDYFSFFTRQVSPQPNKHNHRRIESGLWQHIAGRFIDETKLHQLLKEHFGDKYLLQMSSNNYWLCAKRKLTEEEIMRCC
nr:uncharacterized protein CTRU02_07257 [Colletotrichum truncatum]KAF6791495.1 hypothetical protein CTRU02_07257 [Colletotrichum truncatum]